MIVIMIGGKARVGKTTLANQISKYVYGKGYAPIALSFATILKKEVETRTGLTKENDPEEYRLACQACGAEKRKEDPDYWVKKFEERLNELRVIDAANLETNASDWHEKCVVIDDCRYLNEVGIGRKIGALQIFVSHGTRQLIEHDGAWRKHESEDMANNIEVETKDYTGMFHYTIANNTTLESFTRRVNTMLPEWITYAQDIHDEQLNCDCLACVAHRAGKEISDAEIEAAIEAIYKLTKGQNNDRDD